LARVLDPDIEFVLLITEGGVGAAGVELGWRWHGWDLRQIPNL